MLLTDVWPVNAVTATACRLFFVPVQRFLEIGMLPNMGTVAISQPGILYPPQNRIPLETLRVTNSFFLGALSAAHAGTTTEGLSVPKCLLRLAETKLKRLQTAGIVQEDYRLSQPRSKNDSSDSG